MTEFNYTRSVTGSTWIIVHNLEANETVNDVFINNNGVLEKILPVSVIHTSNNILTITFSNPETGFVRILG